VTATPLHLPVVVFASTHQFQVSLLVLGAVLVAGALVSGLARDTILSLTALFVVTGFVLGSGATHVLHFSARSPFVADLATVALIVILFRDGLEVEGEMLQAHWHLPFRKLVLAMPLTAGIIALATHTLTSLSWTESFLLGALLSPTDPVLSSSVVTNPRVPRLIRHSLNLESGLNDGLALPAVLALAAALASDQGHFVWWRFVLRDLTVGFLTGLIVGLIAAALMRPLGRGLDDAGIPAHQRALFALGTAFATYGIAVLPPKGNGLIAVYVAAITLGIRRPEIRRYFERHAEAVVEIVKLGIFVVFGSLLTVHDLFADGWAAVAIVVVVLIVARPVAVFAALARTPTDTATRAFMAWFGPKGVATMTFSLLVLGDGIAHGSEIFNLAALVVFCSILIHGVSDTPGAEWIARRAERGAAVEPSTGGRARRPDDAPDRESSPSAGRTEQTR
jgi:NhaP-type Na+/H+ or K+/H+ antiporter